MKVAVLAEALGRPDDVAVGLGAEDEARADELPVEQHRARAALALLARVLRPGQAEALAQGEEEALAGPDVRLARLAIDGQLDSHDARQRSRPRAASTRSAWRRYAAVPRTSSIGLAPAATRAGNPSASA